MPEDVFTDAGESFATSKMVRDWLRKPFKPEQIGKLPATQKRPALDFVGHAAVTDRLNKIAPDWSYTVDTMSELNGKVWIRGTMTIGGVSRPEFGDGDDPKEAIGNFIRRGAMRFGVAIDLWSREELEVSDTTQDVSDGGAGSITQSSDSPDSLGGGTPSPVAGEEAGDPPPKGMFPMSPDECDHKSKAGRWLPTRTVNGQAICPRCGQSAIVYRETA